jgi:hypothetical protein
MKKQCLSVLVGSQANRYIDEGIQSNLLQVV